jgi:hypothetical protein
VFLVDNEKARSNHNFTSNDLKVVDEARAPRREEVL